MKGCESVFATDTYHWNKIKKRTSSSPDILGANIPILAVETEGEEIEVHVKRDTGLRADQELRECEE